MNLHNKHNIIQKNIYKNVNKQLPINIERKIL